MNKDTLTIIDTEISLLSYRNRRIKRVTANELSKKVSYFLKLLNIDNLTEYTLPNDNNIKRSRFDIMVFKDNKPFVIIEVKNHKYPKDVPKITKQLKRYSSYGLPLLFISNILSVSNCLNSLNNFIQFNSLDDNFIDIKKGIVETTPD